MKNFSQQEAAKYIKIITIKAHKTNNENNN